MAPTFHTQRNNKAKNDEHDTDFDDCLDDSFVSPLSNAIQELIGQQVPERTRDSSMKQLLTTSEAVIIYFMQKELEDAFDIIVLSSSKKSVMNQILPLAINIPFKSLHGGLLQPFHADLTDDEP